MAEDPSARDPGHVMFNGAAAHFLVGLIRDTENRLTETIKSASAAHDDRHDEEALEFLRLRKNNADRLAELEAIQKREDTERLIAVGRWQFITTLARVLNQHGKVILAVAAAILGILGVAGNIHVEFGGPP